MLNSLVMVKYDIATTTLRNRKSNHLSSLMTASDLKISLDYVIQTLPCQSVLVLGLIKISIS